MITEDYVSFEVAKLLKEKGFDWECKTRKFYPEPEYDAESPNGVYAPTLQMAMKWLREEMGIYIEIRRNLNIFYFKWCIQEGATDKAFSEYKYKSYEEAVEEAIKYSLENLI